MILKTACAFHTVSYIQYFLSIIRNQVYSTLQIYFGDDELTFIYDFNSSQKNQKRKRKKISRGQKIAYIYLVLILIFFLLHFCLLTVGNTLGCYSYLGERKILNLSERREY
jgi:hypothetical protein